MWTNNQLLRIFLREINSVVFKALITQHAALTFTVLAANIHPTLTPKNTQVIFISQVTLSTGIV